MFTNRSLGRNAYGVNAADRERYIHEYAHFFVSEFFFGQLKGNPKRLEGSNLSMLRNACHAVYREMSFKAYEEHKKQQEAQPETDNS
jgi:hypothetical protein